MKYTHEIRCDAMSRLFAIVHDQDKSPAFIRLLYELSSEPDVTAIEDIEECITELLYPECMLE